MLVVGCAKPYRAEPVYGYWRGDPKQGPTAVFETDGRFVKYVGPDEDMETCRGTWKSVEEREYRVSRLECAGGRVLPAQRVAMEPDRTAIVWEDGTRMGRAE